MVLVGMEERRGRLEVDLAYRCFSRTIIDSLTRCLPLYLRGAAGCSRCSVRASSLGRDGRERVDAPISRFRTTT